MVYKEPAHAPVLKIVSARSLLLPVLLILVTEVARRSGSAGRKDRKCFLIQFVVWYIGSGGIVVS